MTLLAPDQLPALPPAVTVPASAQAEAARRRGLAALAGGRWTEASASLEQAVKAERRWPDAYVGLAWSYVRRGQPGMAYLPLEEALRLQPSYAPGWRELARCYYLLRRYERASAAAARATALAPGDGEAWLFRGLAASKGRAPLDALPPLAKASALAPSDPLPFRVRGEVLLGAGRPAEAEPALKTALRLRPADLAAKRALLGALRAQGRRGEALSLGLLREGEAP
jgi:tetratricopeptide (TPR) repeat protein